MGQTGRSEARQLTPAPNLALNATRTLLLDEPQNSLIRQGDNERAAFGNDHRVLELDCRGAGLAVERPGIVILGAFRPIGPERQERLDREDKALRHSAPVRV